MKYNCEILSITKAIIEIIPQTDKEKSLFNKMEKENLDEDTLHYYYSTGLELSSKSAILLGLDSFQKFPTKAIISYGLAVGIGG